MLKYFKIRRAAQCLFLVVGLFVFTQAKAGLIIEISGDIDVSSIKDVQIEGNNLVVTYGANGKKVISLPRGAMDNLLLWVKQTCSGPFVISVDGALVPGASTYTSPCMPPGMADAMIHYDVYAHSFAQGDVPQDSMLHPLILKTGNMSQMPHAQYVWLMDARNQSPDALWYRNLTSRFPSKPGVIGEFTIKAVPAGSGFPVGIAVVSHRWFRPNLWYREVTAASEFDNLTFDLPYAPLKKDLETRFDEYRKNYKPFDELASIVEAYALLKKITQKKPELWNQLIRKRCPNGKGNCISAGDIRGKSGPASSWYDSWDAAIPWSEWSTGAVGETVETSQEADLALCHLWKSGGYFGDSDLDYTRTISWEEGIEAIADNDPDIKAKYLLYQFKNETESEEAREDLAGQFFALTRKNKDLMRLRIVGCRKMLDMEEAEWLIELVAEERDKIVRDFIAAVEALKIQQGKANGDFLPWEDLSQTVYSTGLLPFLQDRLGDDDYRRYTYDSKFARALAEVHYRRGMAFQRGEELAYQHAHFRYLGYLLNKIDDDEDETLPKTILDYQAQLAKHIGITGWNPDDFENAFDYDPFAENEGTADEIVGNAPTEEPWRNSPVIEGELTGADALFTNGGKSATLPRDGSPVGIRSKDGNFTLLLLDSRIFPADGKKSTNMVRAYGITYPDTNAMTPLRVEVKDKSGDWTPLNLPRSGASVGGVFNGQ
ncbi:MAG: hypothetical protein L6Q97_08900 [Thermoanaerobaculia bacterium]|nr:hypothetical protein [Thermoanaerobaculia bacterium]